MVRLCDGDIPALAAAHARGAVAPALVATHSLIGALRLFGRNVLEHSEAKAKA